MELASRPAGCCYTVIFMAAETLGNAPLVLDKLAAHDGVSDLCADGLGYMGVARTSFGADAELEPWMGVAALGP